ncbi:MAG: VWA domain-containing protein [Chloroflexota bacterium]|nr:VWA domain-containing protein [Chloroflexota bacterium]MDE3192112.1 VWA domain-containing protein [Chloroflexota bacterium]
MPSAGFARPEALPLLVAVALLVVLAVWSEARRARATAAFAGRGAELASSDARQRRIKLALLLAAAALSVLALAGPYVDVVRKKVVQSGVDVVVALDVSQSMATRDVDPDRLGLAKSVIQELGDTMTQSRVSLIFFAGNGLIRYPATDDPTILGGSLDAVTPAFKPKGGSSLRGAIDASLQAFSDEARGTTRNKAVILVTDGEDLSGDAPDLATVKERGVHVYALGVGTTAGGPIPTYDTKGTFVGYLKRANGEQVISHLTEAPMQALAQATGGRYWHVASPAPAANDVRTELERLDLAQLGEADGGSVPDDHYQIPLALAVAALIAEGLLSERRDMPRPRWLPSPAAPPRRRTLLPAFVRSAAPWLFLVMVVAGACTQVSTTDADKLYLSGDAQAALDRYRALLTDHPGVAQLHVDAGNALHKLGKYQQALDQYAVGIRQGDARTRAIADYQKGNTLYRMGKLDEAREAYKDALRIDPGDRDAKFNIEVIDRVLGATQQSSGQGQQQPGQQGQQDPSGQSQSSGTDTSGQQPSPADQQGSQTGNAAPQTQGAPSTDTQQTGPSVQDALRQFRSQLTPDEALQLLDALQSEQRGIQQLIEGAPPQQRPGRPQQDPTY